MQNSPIKPFIWLPYCDDSDEVIHRALYDFKEFLDKNWAAYCSFCASMERQGVDEYSFDFQESFFKFFSEKDLQFFKEQLEKDAFQFLRHEFKGGIKMFQLQKTWREYDPRCFKAGSFIAALEIQISIG